MAFYWEIATWFDRRFVSFQVGVEPKVGDTVKAQIVTAESLSEIDQEDWPTEYYLPTPTQAISSLLLIGVGLATTFGISMLGGKEEPEG